MAGKSLFPFLFFFSREKHRALRAAFGTTAGGFRGIIPSILRYALSERCPCWSTSAPPRSFLLHGEISSFVLDLTASRNIQASLFFRNALLFPLQVGCTGFPYDLGYYALVIGLWMENWGNTNGLPWLGGLRTSMWKGEINQANRSFSPDHRTEPIEAPLRAALVLDCSRIFRCDLIEGQWNFV